MLSVRGLNAYYGRAHILADVALEVATGEVVVLLGRNGAGKSTTLKSIIGLVRPASGEIEFDGHRIDGLEPYEIAQAGLGYVPEDRRIFTELTVLENLEVGRQPPRPNAPAWTAEKVFGLFPNLATMQDRTGGRTSGGERHQPDPLFRRHARRGLVHEQQLRLVREGDRKLHPLQVAVRQHRAGAVRLLLHSDSLEQAVGRVAVEARGRPPPPAEPAVVRSERHLHVLADGHRSERGGDLERPPHAQSPHAPRRQAHDLAPFEPDAAGVGRELPVQHVEARRLPRAVRADHGEQLPGGDPEAHVANRLDAAEGLREARDLEDRGHAAVALGLSHARRPPTIPCGNASTMKRIVIPRSARQ